MSACQEINFLIGPNNQIYLDLTLSICILFPFKTRNCNIVRAQTNNLFNMWTEVRTNAVPLYQKLHCRVKRWLHLLIFQGAEDQLLYAVIVCMDLNNFCSDFLSNTLPFTF